MYLRSNTHGDLTDAPMDALRRVGQAAVTVGTAVVDQAQEEGVPVEEDQIVSMGTGTHSHLGLKTIQRDLTQGENRRDQRLVMRDTHATAGVNTRSLLVMGSIQCDL